MLDPLTTSKLALELVTSSLSAIQTVQTFVNKYTNADLQIATLFHVCSSVRIALLRLQELPRPISLGSPTDPSNATAAAVRDDFGAILGSCAQLFAILDAKLRSFNLEPLTRMNKARAGVKLKYLWNQAQIENIASQIDSLVGALNLLVQALQSPTIQDTYSLLRQQQSVKMVKTVADDAQTLYSAQAGEYIHSSGDHTATAAFLSGEENDDFEEMLINTNAYRRVMDAHSIRLRDQSNEQSEFFPSGLIVTKDAGNEDSWSDNDSHPDSSPDPSIAKFHMTQWLEICPDESTQRQIRTMFHHWEGYINGYLRRERLQQYILESNAACQAPIREHLLEQIISPKRNRISSKVDLQTFSGLCMDIRGIAIRQKEKTIKANIELSETYGRQETMLLIQARTPTVRCLEFFVELRNQLAECSSVGAMKVMKPFMPHTAATVVKEATLSGFTASDLDSFSGIAYSLSNISIPRVEEVLQNWSPQLKVLPKEVQDKYRQPLLRLRDLALDLSDEIRSNSGLSNTSELDLALAAAKYLPPVGLRNSQQCPVAALLHMQEKCTTIFQKIEGCMFDLNSPDIQRLVQEDPKSYVDRHTMDKSTFPRKLPNTQTWSNLRICERIDEIIRLTESTSDMKPTLELAFQWANSNRQLAAQITSRCATHKAFLDDIKKNIWRIVNRPHPVEMQFKVIAAHGLPPKISGRKDPPHALKQFVRVYCDKKRVDTKKVDYGQKPVWDDIVSLKHPWLPSGLRIDVFEQSPFGASRSIGSARMDIEISSFKCIAQEPASPVTLTLKSNDGAACGEIILQVLSLSFDRNLSDEDELVPFEWFKMKSWDGRHFYMQSGKERSYTLLCGDFELDAVESKSLLGVCILLVCLIALATAVFSR